MVDLLPTSSLLGAFPKPVELTDGSTVTVRPLRPGDLAALLACFRGIPEDDRWWLREDVSDAAVVQRWISELDYDRVLPLIALADDTIVADASLHRRGFGARRFLAEVRIVVAPAYRGRGLAYALLLELSEVAAAAGLTHLEAEVVAGAQSGALEAVEQMGFQRVASIAGHLVSRTGARHDLVHLVFPLSELR